MNTDYKAWERREVPKVNMGRFRLERYNYDALQRWKGQTGHTLDFAMNLAVQSLPGIEKILQEEKEAYAKAINEKSARIEDVRRSINEEIIIV